MEWIYIGRGQRVSYNFRTLYMDNIVKWNTLEILP